MRLVFICAAIISGISISSAAMAQTAPAAASAAPALKLEPGQILLSSDGVWVGPIDSVQNAKDGSPLYIEVIRDSEELDVPVSTLSVTSKGLVSSLKMRDIENLHS